MFIFYGNQLHQTVIAYDNSISLEVSYNLTHFDLMQLGNFIDYKAYPKK